MEAAGRPRGRLSRRRPRSGDSGDGTPGAKEQQSVEGPPALQSCPMCQKEFSPGLAQLDVDSHLAQCLAESTDDVAW